MAYLWQNLEEQVAFIFILKVDSISDIKHKNCLAIVKDIIVEDYINV